MLSSKNDLIKLARKLDYKPEILEKVYRLLMVLKDIMSVPYLEQHLVLKGGTALNLFSFQEVPRLSVDIDLNYIGQVELSKLNEERQKIKAAIINIAQQNKLEIYRNPESHAGGKMILRYQSVLEQKGNIEIDLNYMYRQPIWPCVKANPKINFGEDMSIPILDIHELAAGKLSAFFTRQASRDFFDLYYLFSNTILDFEKLRLTFVIYLAMTNIQPQEINNHRLEHNHHDIRSKLLPVLRQHDLPMNKDELECWIANLLTIIKNGFSSILPLNKAENDFIRRIRTDGEIKPDLITADKELQELIKTHPALKWAVMKSAQ